MTAPYDQQVELADLLTAAELPTSPEVPEKRSGAFRYVLPNGPWLTAGQGLGTWRVNLRVVCVAAKGTNEQQINDLGAMVRAVIVALKGSRFAATDVDEPAVMTTGAGSTLGAVVNISTSLSRLEFEEGITP